MEIKPTMQLSKIKCSEGLDEQQHFFNNIDCGNCLKNRQKLCTGETRFLKSSHQQENRNESIEKLPISSTKRTFKIKLPFFPKRPFGKHDSLNNSELNFIEIDFKDKTHNLFEKHSKFYKIACGRATSVGRKRDTSRSLKRQNPMKL